MLDYHHHSESSVDSETPMSTICRVAVARGITEIAFTEHMDFIPEEANSDYFNYDRYMTALDAARREFSDDLIVLAGIEIDYCPDFEDEIAQWLRGKEFDFVIGSVHYIRNKGNISEPRSIDFFRNHTIDEVYDPYFELVQQSAETGMWDALGHLDLVKRYGVNHYGPFDVAPFSDRIDAILTTIIRNGIALEVNTSGLRQAPKDLYPAPAILRRYRELGGARLTVGSDSHSDKHTGEGIAEAYATLMEIGFHTVEQFRERKGLSVPIDTLSPS